MRDKSEPLFMISVVARILQVHPQTLRLYEREGFVTPKRSNTQRVYSEEDIAKLKLVIELTRDLGVNKAGVDVIVRLRDRLMRLQSEVETMLYSIDEPERTVFEERIRKILFEE